MKNALRTVASKTVITGLLGCALFGCIGDRFPGAGFNGTYEKSALPLYDIIQFQTGSVERGGFSLGSSQKEECQGDFRAASLKGVFRGKLYCLDGRSGEFEFVSAWPARGEPVGEVTGRVGSDRFRAKISNGKKKCDGGHLCQFGVTWEYADQEAWRTARQTAGL
jgi:hypothetical protein